MEIEITETAPRDGLQNEKAAITVAEKVALIEACAAARPSVIEIGSFVNPARVPQMADTGAVLRALPALPGVGGMVLIPNARRLGEFLNAQADSAFQVTEVAVFVSATETFSQANLGCSVAESLVRVRGIFEALGGAMKVRGYISCATDCPFEGHVSPAAVGALARALRDLGCDTLALADTIGKGTPARVRAMFEAAMDTWAPGDVVAHFHDTGGRALDNADVALGVGVRRFDSSVAGLGGCPYAPGAPGNVATEALADHLGQRGFGHGLDRDGLSAAVALARRLVGRKEPVDEH
ncbi:MAG: hydroxymethylglutaryl-CoA lyase [Pseudomonadota bacterium]